LYLNEGPCGTAKKTVILAKIVMDLPFGSDGSIVDLYASDGVCGMEVRLLGIDCESIFGENGGINSKPPRTHNWLRRPGMIRG
jgi:hypothetical protein